MIKLKLRSESFLSAVFVKDIRFPSSEVSVLKNQTKIITHRVSDDAKKFYKGDYVYAEEVDSNYCFEVTDIKVINNVYKSPYIDDLTKQQIAYLKKFDYIAVLVLKKTKYERPYKLSYIKANYPEKVYLRLKSDEVHSWRARTGIEVIHLEPDQAEQTRTYKNWHLMSAAMKSVSDVKCKELFGVSNEEHYKIVKDEKNISDDPVFKSVISEYKNRFGFDLSKYRLISTKTPRYNNGHPADFPREQFGGCWTTKGVIYLNSELGPVMKFYGVKNKSISDLKKGLIAHELGHGVYREIADAEFKKKYLKLAKDMNFTTEYLEHVSSGKLQEETFCEFMAAIICKTVKV